MFLDTTWATVLCKCHAAVAFSETKNNKATVSNLLEKNSLRASGLIH